MIRPRKPARQAQHLRLRPTLDRLEARALMTTAGNLDPTFGGGLGYAIGPITTDLGISLSQLSDQASVAVESDGSIVVGVPDHTAGGLSFGLQLLNADGTPDTSFGTSGKADVPLPTGFTAFGGPSSVLAQSDGHIIVVGTVSNSTNQDETLVARFNADGTPDATYGTDGVEVLDQATLGTAGLTFAYAALQPDGDVDLAGDADALQLTASGAPDPTFGTGGLVALPQTPNANSSAQMTYGLAVQPNNQIVVLAADPIGIAYADSINADPVLIRLNADGSIDTSLSEAGIQSSGIGYPNSNGLIAKPDGQLLVLGNHTIGFLEDVPALALVNPDGSLATSEPLFGVNTEVTGFALDPIGNVVLAGYFSTAGGTLQAFRLTPNLIPDPTFGVGGFSTPSVSMTGGPLASFTTDSVAITPDDQIIVAGANPSTGADVGQVPPTQYFVAQVLTVNTQSITGDFSGDGISDPAVYIPSQGVFAIGDSSGKTAGEVVPFGVPGAGQTIPALGNYFNPGQADIAAYIVSQGVYAILDPTGKTAGEAIAFGIPGAGQTIPAPGNYYGTGVDDVAVYLVNSGVFAIKDPTGKTVGKEVQFGIPGAGQSIPVPGDYYGTGQDDIAVYLAASGTWAIQDPTGKTSGEMIAFGQAGIGNSIPVPGDYDGSGKTELAVYIPSLAELIYQPAAGGAPVIIPFGVAGVGATLPAPGDYDGSGKTEVAGYLAATGQFAYLPASGAAEVTETFGVAGPGQTIPVTTVPLVAFTNAGSGNSIAMASVMGEPDALDFVFTPESMAKKSKDGDLPTAG
jgi:uncharacterized delta-60 repeat protein